MSDAAVTSPPAIVAPPARPAKPLWRPATLIIALSALVMLTLLAYLVVEAGYLRADIEALQGGEAWRTGGWMAQVVLRVVSLLPDAEWQAVVLALMAASVTGVMFGVLYHRLRLNGWTVLGAIVIVATLGLHAGELYALTASSRAIPLYIALAALIPAIRALEDVGDVQSAITFGMVLPLLLLASPITTLLIVPLTIAGALANPDSWRDGRAFVAMLLVAILPTLIVASGVIGYAVQARLDLTLILSTYIRTYAQIRVGDISGSLMALLAFAPVGLVPLLYCVWRKLPERRRYVWSALAVVGLPLYLAMARQTFPSTMSAIVPPLALVTAFVSWLSVVRLPFALRALSVGLMLASAVLSWWVTGLWDDPEWKATLWALAAPVMGWVGG
ncbi:hypothetical protein SAMN02983003_0517 [Devosia enhydra]|uniref:DUF2029 domain-containing protein n=1 Tax=Devosia enhydra TaxID=665118 RepID=A0A1K2HU30_9HYPH|nr:hypothetical protein [Devosia enhydra]SFZ81469.1 hypothetical protein SAMN02983003_0517 [Devosia enhydra]